MVRVIYWPYNTGSYDCIVKEIPIKSLETSTLSFNTISSYSIDFQNDNVVQAVCKYLDIDSIQLGSIEIIEN